jgi:hypothetical protein
VRQLVCGATVLKFAKHKAIWHPVKVIVNGMKTYLRNAWRLWAKALGAKEGSTDGEADRIALIRSLIALCYIVTNLFIIAGVIRHW